MRAVRWSPKTAVALGVAASLVRLVIALNVAVWAAWPSGADDALMFTYANLGQHFSSHWGTELDKTMSYPFFLAGVDWSGLPYALAMFLVWLAAALAVLVMARSMKVTRPAALLAIFLFVLFCPTAFDSWAGTRLYRNAVIAPTVFIVFAGLVTLAVVARSGVLARWRFLIAAWTGLWLLFAYYIKEDSIWLVPFVLVTLGYAVVRTLVAHRKHWRRAVALPLAGVLPVLVLIGGTEAYKALNKHYYGVAEINTRTSGPFADFMNTVYSVDDHRQWESGVWVRSSTWNKVWAASPTLQSQPALLDAIKTSPWAMGSWHRHTPHGDLAGWAMQTAMIQVGLWSSEAKAADFMTRAEADLKRAQADGTLPKSHKFVLAAGAPGRSWSEIKAIRPLVVHGLKTNLLNSAWSARHFYCPDATCQAAVSPVINQPILTQDEADALPGQVGRDRAWDAVGNTVIKLYHWASYPLLLLTFLGLVLTLGRVRSWRRRGVVESNLVLVGAAAALAASAFVVVFGVAWYGSWIVDAPGQDLTRVLSFYTVAATPCLMLAEVIMLIALAQNLTLRMPTRRRSRAGLTAP